MFYQSSLMELNYISIMTHILIELLPMKGAGQ